MKKLLTILLFASLFSDAQSEAQKKRFIDELFGKTNIIHVGSSGFIEKDKTLHFNGGALIGSSVYMYTYYKTDNLFLSLLAAVASGIVVGVSKELYDKSKGKVVSRDDIVFTVSGSIGGAITKIIQIDIQQQNKMLSAEYKSEFENLNSKPILP